MGERRHAKAKVTSKRGAARRPTGRPTPVGRHSRPASASSGKPASKKATARKATARKATASKATARTKPGVGATSRSRPFAARPAKDPTARPTAAERAAAETRRNRIPVALGAAAAAIVLVSSFPLSVLLGQHRQLSAEAAQLSSIKEQNRLLAEQRLQLNSNAEVKRLARQNYQLVEPGQSLYLILPPAGRSTSSTPGASTAGDPANQPLVAPAQAPNMSPDPGLPATAVPATSVTGGQIPSTTGAKASGGFWSRVGSTLEFWK